MEIYNINEMYVLNSEELNKGKLSTNGVDPFKRPIYNLIQYGCINLDKPAGPTSHEVVSIVKKILGIEKAGHPGTLDPQVTGVLPICLLNATKILSVLTKSTKKYVCNMYSTDSIPAKQISNIFDYFTGHIYQVPPLKSNVVKKLRIRQIYSLNLIEQKDRETLFDVTCQSGTYIRTLCNDIGRAIGTYSYMKELRRVKTGVFHEKYTSNLHQLFDAWEEYKETGNEKMIRQIIMPLEIAITHLPKIIVRENAVDPICHGSNLTFPGILAFSKFNINENIAILTPKGELIAIANSLIDSSSIKNMKYGNIAHPFKIIMPRRTYPYYNKLK